MIILPQSLPSPLSIDIGLPSSIVTARSELSCNASNDDLLRNLPATIHRNENYIDIVFNCVVGSDAPWPQYIGRAHLEVMTTKSIPWQGFSKFEGPWTLLDDLEAVAISTALSYVRLASDTIEELIDLKHSPESELKWKQVLNFYKKLIGFCKFGQQLNPNGSKFETSQWHILTKIADVCIQMVILAKLGWAVRNGISQSNCGALARVSIHVVDEMRSCQAMAEQLNQSKRLTLKCRDWAAYFKIVEQYAAGYASFFLARELHQQNKLGEAIGLVNYGLVALQSKKSISKDTHTRVFTKLRLKMHQRRHEKVLKHLSSVLTLVVADSVFSHASSAMITDIACLFDQLNELHLTLTSENNTLKFDTVVEWHTIAQGSKWPLGNKIPVCAIPSHCPPSLPSLANIGTEEGYY